MERNTILDKASSWFLGFFCELRWKLPLKNRAHQIRRIIKITKNTDGGNVSLFIQCNIIFFSTFFCTT